MLKFDNLKKNLGRQSAEALRLHLELVPAIKLLKIEHEALKPDHRVDIVAHVEVYGMRQTLVCKVKSSGQSRHVRLALLQLRDYVANHVKDTSGSAASMARHRACGGRRGQSGAREQCARWLAGPRVGTSVRPSLVGTLARASFNKSDAQWSSASRRAKRGVQ